MNFTRSRQLICVVAGLMFAGCGMDYEESPGSLEVATQAVTTGSMAIYDTTFLAPACLGSSSSCDTGTLIDGRGTRGPESNAPNTLFSSCADGTSGAYHVDESVDRLRISTQDGGPFLPGKQVTVEATVWGYRTYTYDWFELYYATDANAPQWTQLASLQATQAGAHVLSASFTLSGGANLQAIRAVFRYTSSPGPCVAANYTDRDDLVFRLGDAPPAVSLSVESPVAGGTVRLSASASDDLGVDRVLFYAGAQYLGYDPTAPYALNWNSTLYIDGTYTLTARAVDSTGQTTTSAPITFVVDNTAPSVAFTAPSAGALLSGVSTLTASASDANGVVRVEFLADGTLVGSDESAPYALDWNTIGIANGSHLLTAKAYDAAGHVSQAQVMVTVHNDLPPTGSITAPGSGAVLSGTANLSVNALDDLGVDRVTFYIGTHYITWDGTPPYSINFNTLNYINGNYTLTARIFDTAGKMTVTTEVPVTIQN
jgi:Bacterial Ig domain